MINLHPWICSQTSIFRQTRYRLRYAARLNVYTCWKHCHYRWLMSDHVLLIYWVTPTAISLLQQYQVIASPVYLRWKLYRGSYMSAHVLLNLLNKLRKRDKMRGLPSILSLFRNEFNKFNKTRARMLDSIYHMTLRILWNLISGVKTL